METPNDIQATALEVFTSATLCGDHPQPWTEADLGEAVAAVTWGDYETAGAAIFALKSGGFLVVTEWSDCTGHG